MAPPGDRPPRPRRAAQADDPVSASDTEATPKTASATVKITVGAPVLAITTAALPSRMTGDDYSATVTAVGGSGAYTWSATGLPYGLAIGAGTGTISGVLGDDGYDDPGPYPVTVTVKDASTSVSKQFSLVVTPRQLSVSAVSSSAATSGIAYTLFFGADGGTGVNKWTVTGLPPGLSVGSLSNSGGDITGTPGAVTVATTYIVTITAVDSAGVTASTSVKIVLTPPAGSDG